MIKINTTDFIRKEKVIYNGKIGERLMIEMGELCMFH